MLPSRGEAGSGGYGALAGLRTRPETPYALMQTFKSATMSREE